jgi:hypothetical protein
MNYLVANRIFFFLLVVKVGFIWHFHIPHNRKNCNGNSFCVKAPDILMCPFKLHLVDTSANQNCVTATNLVEKK